MNLDYKEVIETWNLQKPQGRSRGKAFWLSVKNAIEKQIPLKPRIETTKEAPITHNLGRTLYFYCPKCGKFIVGLYERDKERGGGISARLNGCSNCLQAIDFSEWQKQEADDLILED